MPFGRTVVDYRIDGETAVGHGAHSLLLTVGKIGASFIRLAREDTAVIEGARRARAALKGVDEGDSIMASMPRVKTQVMNIMVSLQQREVLGW